MVWGPPKQKRETIQKTTKAKRARGVAQVIELLSSKCDTLNSNPSTMKKRKKSEGFNNIVLGELIKLYKFFGFNF
jgi:hypothetical protein